MIMTSHPRVHVNLSALPESIRTWLFERVGQKPDNRPTIQLLEGSALHLQLRAKVKEALGVTDDD